MGRWVQLFAVLVAAGAAACELSHAGDAVPVEATEPPAPIATVEPSPARPPEPSAVTVLAATAMHPVATASASAPAPVEAPEPACPPGMQHILKYCVDRYEAHLVRVEPDGTEREHAYLARPKPGVRYEARSARSVYPQAYISRVEAKAACENAGKRLCTANEWWRACRGPRGKRYPYDGQEATARCNSGKRHIFADLFGTDSNRWKYDKHFNSYLPNLIPGYLEQTGAYEECVSDDGVFDMVGNLHEWVDGWVDEELMDRLEAENVKRRKQPWREGNGIFLGGFYSTTRELGPGCHYVTVAHEPRYHDYSTGFRCCATATRKAPAPPKRPPKTARR